MEARGEEAGARPDVSEEEVEALLGARPSDGPAPAVVTYDFASPDRLAAGRMPAFDRLNERWTKDFGRELAERFRRPLEVTPSEVQLMPFADWQAGVSPPSSLNVYDAKPLGRNAVIAVDGKLLFALVDGYYGGGVRADMPARASLTRAELRLATILVELFAKLFRQAFEPVVKLDLKPLGAEENPQYVAIASPGETVAVLRVNVVLNERGGAVSLVLPHACLEPFRDELVEGVENVSPEARARWRSALTERLADAELEVACVLLETELTVRELLRLEPGDVLPVELPESALLCAGDKPLLKGKFGSSGTANAIRVIEAVKQGTTNSEVSRR